jgi:hypothetical protein
MSQLDYLKRQVAVFRRALNLELDIAEQDKRGLQIAIIEYEKCIAYLQRDAERIQADRIKVVQLTPKSKPLLSTRRLVQR